MASVALDKPQNIILPPRAEKPWELLNPNGAGLLVEDVEFPPAVTSPRSLKNLFLAGAGVRGVQINPQVFIKVTCLGFYFEQEVLSYLSEKWAGKSSEELASDEEFFADIIRAPFEKFTRVTMLQPRTGSQFAEKILDNTKQELLAANALGEDEEKAIEQFHELFKDQNFPRGAGPFFVFSPAGVSVAFSKDGCIPEAPAPVVVGNKAFAEGMLSTMIGKNGVSPAAKASIAEQIGSALACHSGGDLLDTEVIPVQEISGLDESNIPLSRST